MEKNVTSLGISKKLEKANFGKYSKWGWVLLSDFEGNISYKLEDIDNVCHVPAYQVNELLSELPRYISKGWLCLLEIHPVGDDYWCVAYRNGEVYTLKSIQKKTLQDALALMIMWLEKNGYIKFKGD